MPPSRLIVVSDLDGTLLDHETYSFDAARPALARLRQGDVPLVLCTSKTRAEVESIRVSLENNHPFIVENGGAVVIPRDYFSFDVDRPERRGDMLVIPIGDPYHELVEVLARASVESGVAVRGFSTMTDGDVAEATGLSLVDARRARQREFDEPFEILDPAGTGVLLDAISRGGKRWTAGGRFHHITGMNDKAAAVRIVMDLYRRESGAVKSVGLGDALNDVDFLREVDVPIVIASPNGDDVARLVPRARITRAPGPQGWNEAVLETLNAWRLT